MRKLIIASSNQGKIREFRALLQDFPWQIYSLADLNYLENVNETGTTFFENAKIKAANIFQYYPNCFVLADDSGLCVTALNDAPGIYTARYGGKDLAYKDKFTLLWQELIARQIPRDHWQAHFVCSLCLLCPWGDMFNYTGEFHGEIASEARGENGFGYDPIFYVPEYNLTAAEMKADLKNKISHRARALEALLADLPRVLALDPEEKEKNV